MRRVRKIRSRHSNARRRIQSPLHFAGASGARKTDCPAPAAAVLLLPVLLLLLPVALPLADVAVAAVTALVTFRRAALRLWEGRVKGWERK